MSMKLFAEKYRVKVRYTGSEIVAPGKCGEIADDYGDGNLRLRLTAVPANSSRDRLLNQRAEQARLGGMVLHQKNGSETVWLFSPDNDQHCLLAIRLVQPKRRRVVNLTPEQRRDRINRLRTPRKPPFLGEVPLQQRGSDA
jgi:hypothetical protein